MNGSLFVFKFHIQKGGKENVTSSVAEQNHTPKTNYPQKWQSNFLIVYGIGKTGIIS